MGLPNQPVTLTVEQIENLSRQLAAMRHDVNNHLAVSLAAVELIRHKPAMTERMLASLAEQPAKITQVVAQFSREFETTFGIMRG
jgi:hypothetical protein